MEISLKEGKNKAHTAVVQTLSKGQRKRIPDITMILVSKLYHTEQSESDKTHITYMKNLKNDINGLFYFTKQEWIHHLRKQI